jgi:cell division septation protein DedD
VNQALIGTVVVVAIAFIALFFFNRQEPVSESDVAELVTPETAQVDEQSETSNEAEADAVEVVEVVEARVASAATLVFAACLRGSRRTTRR